MMQVLLVDIKVKPDRVEAFKKATLENAAASRKEPGIARFELLADAANPCHFVLVEGYRDADAPARHKETAHYLKWKELAEPMLAEPRTRALFELLEPA
jgi:(4S)-4-hydroxy-5-phosphonooxypentane-2,3-dione isomerase